MAQILVLEDDPDIASVLRRGLGAAGHQIVWAETIDAAQEALSHNQPDAAIIDMMLGQDSGADFLVGLRAKGYQIPAIILSALARVEERSEGLAAGAQDYVVKPFSLAELLARLEVQLHINAPKSGPLVLGRLAYDPASRSAYALEAEPRARAVVLTEREGDLLAYMMQHPGHVLTRGALFDAIWAQHGGSTENVVDVYLGYLRRKLGNFLGYGVVLRTLRGRGFVLKAADQDEG